MWSEIFREFSLKIFLRQFLSKLDIYLPEGPAIPLLSIYTREIKTYVHTKTCTQIFVAALFLVAKTGSNPNFHKLIN